MEGSEVARIRAEIDAAAQAAFHGLYGLRSGSARHEVITACMERYGEAVTPLIKRYGDPAIALTCEILERHVSREH